jgi:RNA polymerase sigma factor (sigma-70 family)
MKEYSDEVILNSLKARQGFVVKFMEERYLPMIRLMVVKLGGSSEDAKDIFQDGLEIILDALDKNSFNLSCKFKTFLYSICENRWKSELRRRRAAANYLLRNTEYKHGWDFSDSIDEDFHYRIFYEAFNTLDPVAQGILKLDWQGISLLKIAKKLGYSYGYVRKKKSESEKELKRRIHENREYISLKREEALLKTIIT